MFQLIYLTFTQPRADPAHVHGHDDRHEVAAGESEGDRRNSPLPKR